MTTLELAPVELAELARPTTADELAGAWLLGYSRATRQAYAADLREWAGWLDAHDVAPFDAHRAHVEAFVRGLEDRGRAKTTITRKLAALAGFYAYALDEELIGRSPVARVRRPQVADDSQRLGLDRGELRDLIAAAAGSGPRDLALVLLLGLNGLRVSEVVGAKVRDLGTARGHRTLAIVRKRQKLATVPLAPRTAEAVDAYLAGRAEEELQRPDAPLLATRTGMAVDRHAAGKTIRRLAVAAGIGKTISPHSLRHSFVTLALDAGVALRDVQDSAGHSDPKTTRRYDRGRHSLDRNATFAVAAAVG